VSTKPIQEEWFNTILGTKLDPDGHYGLQCVDLVDHYAQYIFGVPWQQCVGGVNGAKDLMRVAPSEYWIKIYNDPNNPNQIPERGDVFVFGGDYLNEFGHTGATDYASLLQLDVVQQDGFAKPRRWVDGAYYSDKPAHRATLGYYQLGTGELLGWLRPRPEKIIGGGESINPAGEITTPQETELSAEEVNKILSAIADIAKPGVAGERNAGPLYDLVQAVNGLPSAVWKTPVTRDGQKIIALQEVADAKTIALRVETALKTLQTTVDGLEDPDPTQIKEAVSQGLSEAIKAITTVTTVTTKDPK
jgi:hypothetical protein